MADFESAVDFDRTFFLENYNIYNQFKSISDSNIDLLDFNNTFNMYVTEAKIFGKKGIFIDDLVAGNSFGNCPGLHPFPPNSGIDFKNKIIKVGETLPTIPREYFLTGEIDLNNWKENYDYILAEKAKDFISTLPD